MRLYRPTYTKNGVKRRCQVWYVQASINGKRFRKTTGCRDRRAATQRAAAMIRDAERIAAGLDDPFEKHWARPVDLHISDFEATLRARGRVEQYIRDRIRLLRAFVTFAGCESLKDLDDADASRWLSDELQKGLSARTVNARYQALRQFGRWLVQAQRLRRAPFASLRALRESTDRRRVRRALNSNELERLLAAAARRPLDVALCQRVNAGVSLRERKRLTRLGQVRAVVYAVAAGTGLRKGELRRLRWRDVDFDGALITVPAASAKSRKEQVVPLRSDLAELLQVFRPVQARPRDLVISKGEFPSLRAFKRDLVAAGLATVQRKAFDDHGVRYKQPREIFETEDEHGRIVDFHSLRYTFVTRLAQAGVHPRTAQALARHAKLETTMDVYTDLRLLDLKEAIERTTPPTG